MASYILNRKLQYIFRVHLHSYQKLQQKILFPILIFSSDFYWSKLNIKLFDSAGQ